MAQRIIECLHCHRKRFESRMNVTLDGMGLCLSKGTCKIKAKDWRRSQRALNLPAHSYYGQQYHLNNWREGFAELQRLLPRSH